MTKVWTNPNPRHLQMINVAEIVGCAFERLENIVERGKNAGGQHFLRYATMVPKAFLIEVVNGIELFG